MDMTERILRGYQEIEHTADWALKVWAPDLGGLLVEAALGMTALMEIAFEGPLIANRQIELSAEDGESLLVAFLSELLYLGESQGIGFSQARLIIHDLQLTAELGFFRIKSKGKKSKQLHITIWLSVKPRTVWKRRLFLTFKE